jgi:hypothetical protein
MLEFTSVLVSDFRATTDTTPTDIIARTITDRTTGITDIGIIAIIILIIIGAKFDQNGQTGAGSNLSQPNFSARAR